MVYKKFIIIIAVAALILSCDVSADPLILFSSDKKYGYVDQNLNIIIPAIYEYAGHFSKLGYAVVRLNEKKSAIIDRFGRVVFERDVINIFHLAEDLYSFDGNDGVSVIYRLADKKIIANGVGFRGWVGSDPYILVGLFGDRSRYGFLDFNGNRILPNIQMKSYSYPFSEGRAVITKENWDYSIIDLLGNEVSSLKIHRIGQSFSEGLVPAQTEDKVTGYLNRDGFFEFKIPFIVGDSPEATNFRNGFALIKIILNPDMWAVINKKGEIVSPYINVEAAFGFNDGLSVVRKYNATQNKYMYGYVNVKGDYLVPPILDDCDPFRDGYARIVFNGRDGLLDTKGVVYWSDLLLVGKKEGALLSIPYKP